METATKPETSAPSCALHTQRGAENCAAQGAENGKEKVLRFYDMALCIATQHKLTLSEQLAQTRDALAGFRVMVPVVGSFNTGKSALLNAVMGLPLLPTNVVAETFAPTELSYGEPKLFITRGTARARVGIGELHSSQFDKSGVDKLELSFLCEPLRALAQLCLVDMPGLDAAHGTASTDVQQYLTNSLAYILVFSAEEPVLKESVCNFLSQLQLRGIPVYVVLTKCDKVTDAEKATAVRFFRETLAQQLGLANVPICTACAKGAVEVSAVWQLLQELRNQADALCYKAHSEKLLPALHSMEAFLQTRLAQQNETPAQAQVQKEAIDLQKQRWEETISTWETALFAAQEPLEQAFSAAMNKQLLQMASSIAIELQAKGKVRDVDKLVQAMERLTVAVIASELAPRVQKQLRTLQRTITLQCARNRSDQDEALFAQFESWNTHAASVGRAEVVTLVSACSANFQREDIAEILRAVQEKKVARTELSAMILSEIIPSISTEIAQGVTRGLADYFSYLVAQVRDAVQARWAMMEVALDVVEEMDADTEVDANTAQNGAQRQEIATDVAPEHVQGETELLTEQLAQVTAMIKEMSMA